MNEQWIEELSRFSSLDQKQKILWLCKLLFYISMFARDTYQEGTEQVDKPEVLRKYNELLHRIASFQLEINENNRKLDEQFFMMLADAVNNVGLNITSLLEKLN